MKMLSVTGGHRVDIDAFASMLGFVANELDADWSHAFQPSAQRWLCADTPFDVIVLHDLPGLALRRGSPPTPIAPTPEQRAALGELTERGVGLVVLHHALAGWPSWDGWADALGARFSYASGTYRGTVVPSSGTRLDRFTVSVTAPEHPVCAGVTAFTIDDEPYHFPVHEHDVVGLLRSDADTSGQRFISTYEHVLVGANDAPNCAPLGDASNLVGWASSAGASPIIVIQPGDSGATFGHPQYRRLLTNAVAWVASEPARAWARERKRPLDRTHVDLV